MEAMEIVEMFFRRRWPDGFSCPRCGFREFYTIRTRRLPLYQCRFCRHQTTVTAGTIMDKSRAPLEKWAAALELLASASGMNAVELADRIDVTHKTAWLIMRRLRRAISELETERKLAGVVHGGLRTFVPRRERVYSPLWTGSIMVLRPYRKEYPVFAAASLDERGLPTALKLRLVAKDDLAPRRTETLAAGSGDRLLSEHSDPCARTTLLKRVRTPILWHFEAAEYWLYKVYHRVGENYLQTYLDEYCFRWNVAKEGRNLRDAWAELCTRAAVRATAGASAPRAA